MFIAYDTKSNRVDVRNAIKGEIYYCPCCGSELIVKQGLCKQWHFAHKSKKNCDTWYEMSEWHKGWQEEFPEHFREIVLSDEHEKHRADIKVGELVVEFQKSPMTLEEFKKRCNFYSKNNNLIWLFDIRDKPNKPETTYYSNTRFTWKYAYKFNLNFTFKNNIQIFLQTHNNNIIWCRDLIEGLKVFEGLEYTRYQFMNHLRYIYRQINQTNQTNNRKKVFIVSDEELRLYGRLNGYE